eukprot:jgi/Hompol1/1775/HPOL_005715-RA
MSIYKYFGWTRLALISSPGALFSTMAASVKSYFPTHGIDISSSTVVPLYDPTISLYYFPQLQNTFEFLKVTKLRIFMLVTDAYLIQDLMMAANRTGLMGYDYGTYSLHRYQYLWIGT